MDVNQNQPPTGPETNGEQVVAPAAPGNAGGNEAPVNWEAKAKELEGQLGEVQSLKQFKEQVLGVLDGDEDLDSHFDHVIRKRPGPWTPKSVATPPAEGPKPPATKPDTANLPPEIQQKLREHDEFIATTRRERALEGYTKEIESEMSAISDEFPWANDSIKTEFVKRVEDRIKKDSESLLLQNPTLGRKEARARAEAKWSGNFQASFVLLMKDKIMEQLGEAQKRPKLPFQVQTPADRLGKPGPTPDDEQAYKQALAATEDPDKRAEIKQARADQLGISVDELFKGKRLG